MMISGMIPVMFDAEQQYICTYLFSYIEPHCDLVNQLWLTPKSQTQIVAKLGLNINYVLKVNNVSSALSWLRVLFSIVC